MPHKKRQTKSTIFVVVSFVLGITLVVLIKNYYKTSYKIGSLIVGGLGLFIYGMKIMSEGLQEIAGEKLRKTLRFLTGNRFAGVLTGAGITAIIQSSSATTVMLVGFVNSGLITLTQAGGVILGANIGTTITGQLIAFKLKDLALPAIALGSAMYMFGKSDRAKYIGKVALGFGMLFFALGLMSGSLKTLRTDPNFRSLFIKFSSNPLYGLLAGTILTVVVQSSSVTVAITMSLAATGLISFSAAIPIILGDNIGTTITALIASIGTNLAAKRAAIVHTLFNVFGAIIILIFISPYTSIINKITHGDVPVTAEQIPHYIHYTYEGHKTKVFVKLNDKYVKYNEQKHNKLAVYIQKNDNYLLVKKKKLKGNIKNMLRHVANAHTVFNLLNVLIWLPLLGFLTWAAKKIYPGVEEIDEENVKHIDKRMLKTPPIAVEQIRNETYRMFKLSREMLEITMEMVNNFNKKKMEKLLKKERVVNMLENAISEYAYLLFDKPLTEDEKLIINFCLNSIHEIERIGDHCLSMGESLEYRAKHDIDFTEPAEKELLKMFDMVKEIHDSGLEYFTTHNDRLIPKIEKFEENIDNFRSTARKKHIKRMNKKMCRPGAGIIFVDLLNNLERLADHIHNVASLAAEGDLNEENY